MVTIRTVTAVQLTTSSNSSQRPAGKASNPPPDGGKAIFLAGVEGTGHHFWMDVFQACTRSGRCREPGASFVRRLWWNKDNLDSLTNVFQTENLHAKSPTLVLNGFLHQMSYPDCGIRDPRMDNYFRAAIAAGDELKVLVLLRDADHLLASDKRRFGRSASTLVASADKLLHQLKALPRKSFMCVDYESLPRVAPKVEKYLSADGSSQFYDHKKALEEFHHSHHSGIEDKALREKMKSIEILCNAEEQEGAQMSFAEYSESQAQRVLDFLFT